LCEKRNAPRCHTTVSRQYKRSAAQDRARVTGAAAGRRTFRAAREVTMRHPQNRRNPFIQSASEKSLQILTRHTAESGRRGRFVVEFVKQFLCRLSLDCRCSGA
jgi:hypothetical protein